MNYSFECPKCKAELTAEVDIADHMVEGIEECDECGCKFTESEQLQLYSDAMEDGFGSMIDHAHDLAKDREMRL